MKGYHGTVVHLVDVVTGKDQHELGRMVPDDVEVLVHGVGRARVPVGGHPLLCGKQFNELAELAAQEAPAALDVQDQRVRLVLCQHPDAPDTGVDAVRQREIDDAELPGEGYRRLCPPAGHILEAGTTASSQDQRQGVSGETTDETRI